MNLKLLFTITLAATTFLPLFAYSSECYQKGIPVPPPTKTEIKEVLDFLNTQEPLRGYEACKGNYVLKEESNDSYYKRWNIGCHEMDGMFSLFKGMVDNTGEEKYILASEGGSGSYNGLAALLSKKKGKLKLLAPEGEMGGVLPGSGELSNEAAAMPGHLAYPFLTTACGNTYMNFVDHSWTVDTIHGMAPSVYLWKDGVFKVVGEKALKKWIAAAHDVEGCKGEDGLEDAVYIGSVKYFDFDHDGKNEVIVNASTCWTGTAGPDVHTVLSAKDKGGFVGLKIPEPDKKSIAAAKMEGNRNYRLGVEDGLLVATWYDDSGREVAPLIVKYKWDGKAFSVVAIEVSH